MLYVINTPPLFGQVGNTNNDDGKFYGVNGCLSYPKLQELQAAVELWAQYYGCLYSEWANGIDSAYTHWDFWNQQGTGPFFHQPKTVFDWKRLRYLCELKSPDFWYSLGPNFGQHGGLFIGTDPMAQYDNIFAQENSLFQDATNLGYSEGFINDQFANVLQQGEHWYYSDSSVTGITKALAIKDLKPVWYPNQLVNKKDIRHMWQELQNVANQDLYFLTPSSGGTMFARNGTADGEPFTAMPETVEYTTENSYQRQRRVQELNHIDVSRDIDTGYVMKSQGYVQNTFDQHHLWRQDAEYSNNQFHYVWSAIDDQTLNTNNHMWLYKVCPIPSTLFGQNVPVSRDVLIVWEVNYRIYQKKSTWSDAQTTTRTYWVISEEDFASSPQQVARFVDIDGFDYGRVLRWRFPFIYFDDYINRNNNIYHEIMNNVVGFYPSFNQNCPFMGDTGWHDANNEHWIFREYSISMSPVFFYSCARHRLTQSVTYPQQNPSS